MTNIEIRQAMKDILSYFLRNPGAADDLEGIARWRIAHELMRRRVEETHLALEALVKKDFLIQNEPPGGRRVFSLNPARSDEAKKYLESDSMESAPEGAGEL